jgi:hypothetical protein
MALAADQPTQASTFRTATEGARLSASAALGRPKENQARKYILNLVGHQPNQNLESTICRSPKAAPKHEKKQTVKIPKRLKKRQVRIASTKPRWKSDLARTPMAKELTTMLAASHYVESVLDMGPAAPARSWQAMKQLQLGTHHAANVEIGRVRPFIGRYTFYTSLLNVELSGQPLKPGVQRIAIHKGFPRHSTIAATVERPLFCLGSFLKVVVNTTEHYDGVGAIAPCFSWIETTVSVLTTKGGEAKLMVRVKGRAQAQRPGKVREREKEDVHIFLFSFPLFFFIFLSQRMGKEPINIGTGFACSDKNLSHTAQSSRGPL